MKRPARIRTHRIAFAALHAARRWRRVRGAVARSRAAWMPLALRWRRPRSVAPTARSRARAPASEAAIRQGVAHAMPRPGIERLVRERLHFATATHEARSRLREHERLAVATTSRETYALRELARPRDSSVTRSWRARSGMRMQRVEILGARRAGPALTAPRGQAGEAAPRLFPGGVTRDAAPMMRPRPMRARQDRGVGSGAAMQRRVAHAAASAPVPAAAVAALQRTAPLAWRQRDSGGDGKSVTVRDPAPALRESIAARAESAARPATRSPAPAVSPSPPPAMPRLDAAFVDRLAEDVIRRVEKRARIERERRGL